MSYICRLHDSRHFGITPKSTLSNNYSTVGILDFPAFIQNQYDQ